jgi:hypothetical protein
MTAPTYGQPLDERDLAILADLRAVLTVADPMPPDLGDQVQFALTVQALHAEIAELEQLPGEVVGARSVDYTRVLTVTFTSESVSVVITITHLDNETARLDGWVEGPTNEVELRGPTRTSTAPIDAEGRFAFPQVERGQVQFVFWPLTTDSKPVITPRMEV